MYNFKIKEVMFFHKNPDQLIVQFEAVKINIDKTGNISTKMRQTCAYADDISIIARSRDALVETFNTLRRDAKKFGLKINQGKTKYMRNTRKEIKTRNINR
jgi:hypothetical protein